MTLDVVNHKRRELLGVQKAFSTLGGGTHEAGHDREKERRSMRAKVRRSSKRGKRLGK